MEAVEIIGLVAGLLTTMSFVPQAWKIYRTKSARDVSLHMFLAFSVGVALWLVYGLIKKDLAIVVANVVTLALAAWIVVMKLRYDR
jgi:MtN3 and saliva related transmembrane protein